MNFVNAYTTAPLCTPARGSIHAIEDEINGREDFYMEFTEYASYTLSVRLWIEKALSTYGPRATQMKCTTLTMTLTRLIILLGSRMGKQGEVAYRKA